MTIISAAVWTLATSKYQGHLPNSSTIMSKNLINNTTRPRIHSNHWVLINRVLFWSKDRLDHLPHKSYPKNYSKQSNQGIKPAKSHHSLTLIDPHKLTNIDILRANLQVRQCWSSKSREFYMEGLASSIWSSSVSHRRRRWRELIDNIVYADCLYLKRSLLGRSMYGYWNLCLSIADILDLYTFLALPFDYDLLL